MKTFLDSANPQRTWQISLNVGTIKRVKGLLPDVDLVEINEGKPPLILRLATDPCLLCDVLYVLCKPAADEAKITDEQFGEAMGGDALQAGQKALFDELTDFFLKLGRTEKATVVSQAERVVTATMEAADRRLKEVDIEALSEQAVGKLYTDARESLDRTLGLTHSAN